MADPNLTRNGVQYSMPDQVARFANAKATNDTRYLDITTVYDGDGVYVDMFGGDRASGFVDPSEWTGFIIDQIDWVARHTGARRVGRATCAHARARFRSFFARRRLHLHAPLRDGNWL